MALGIYFISKTGTGMLVTDGTDSLNPHLVGVLCMIAGIFSEDAFNVMADAGAKLLNGKENHS